MQEVKAEALALIAESIRRGVGVPVGDVHLGLGLALYDQIRGHRPRRTAKSVRSLNGLLRSRRDRSLAAAFPALYIAAFAGLNACVMVTDESLAHEDAELYRGILTAFDDPVTVRVLADDGYLPPAAAGKPTLTLGTPEAFSRLSGHEAVIIARLSPKATERIVKNLKNTAGLPDL